MRNILIGFVLGLSVTAGLAWAQGYEPYQNPYGSLPNAAMNYEQALNSASIMRDGGVSYQQSFTKRNPCD